MNALYERIILYRIQKLADRKAFEVVYDSYRQRIARFLNLKISDQEVVADLLNEVFLKTWRYLRDDEPVEHLQALIFQIARTTVADYYRCRTNDQMTALDSEEAEMVPSKEVPAEQLDSKMRVERVRRALPKLKESYREAIVLRYFEEMSIEEIALALEKSPGTVRVLIHRAVSALEKLLDE